MTLPTWPEIKALHLKYAPSEEAFQSVFTHCRIVAEIAAQLTENSADANLVQVGCLLHDIGVYRLYEDGKINEDKYICHGILGDELLRNEGFDEQLCRFASHHTGVSITKEDVVERNLPLPHEDFLAENEEELLVMYADKFHSKSTPPRFNSPEFYTKFVAKFGEANKLKFQEMIAHFGTPDLRPLSEKYGHAIV